MANEIVLSDNFKTTYSVLKSPLGLDSYPVETAYNMIKHFITAPSGVLVTEKDVAELMLVAQSMGLNPLKKSVYGFKNKEGQLICGVTLQGWRQAADAREGKVKRYRYGQLMTVKQDGVEFRFYDWIACDFKINGEWTEGQQVFFEEVDKAKYLKTVESRLRSPWRVQPKRMHQNRAYTCAVAELFGFGAYSIEEARYAANINSPIADPEEEPIKDIQAEVVEDKPQAVNKGIERLNNEIKKQEEKQFDLPQDLPEAHAMEVTQADLNKWKDALNSATNLHELVSYFRQLSPELQKDKEVIAYCAELKTKFQETK